MIFLSRLEYVLITKLFFRLNYFFRNCLKYQPSGASNTRSLLATTAKSKITARGSQNGRRGLERCVPQGFWAFLQHSLSKFFDLSTSFMRKVDDGGEKRKNNDGKSGHQRHCQSNAQPPTDWNANWFCQNMALWYFFYILNKLFLTISHTWYDNFYLI